MNSDKNDETDVPAGWELCISKKNTNRKYYFNRKTGESSWTRPQAVKSPEENKSKKIREENKPKGKASKQEIKKILKRKSDGSNTQTPSKKKPKEEKPTEKHDNKRSAAKKRASTGSIRESPKFTPNRQSGEITPLRSPKHTPSPAKRTKETAKTRRSSDRSPKPTPSKNTASVRLSLLRAELAAEAKNEEAKETTTTAQAAKTTPEKTQRQEILQNEPQTTSLLSPSETAQSALSPSQFFAANKIIYSMIAQLPDRDSLKPKDAFADIEEGINNQTTEYPFMKHPATPPQFSEASKLMSAINSKLSYRKEPVETPVNIFKATETCHKSAETPTSVYNVFKSADTPVYKFADISGTLRADSPGSTFRSARDRMDALRKRLSSENMDAPTDTLNERHLAEAMDVDPRETRIVPEPSIVPEAKTNATANSKENVILVVDTNIFIHELDFIKNIMNSHIEGYTEQPTLLVPWRVINELDKLKDSNNGNGAICKRARPAMDYLYKSLPENNRIKVQPLRDANSHIYPCESPDDEILNCCLQQAERGKSVILLSNDKNLCTKAVANGVETKQLRALVLKPHTHPTVSPLSAARLKKHIFTLLSNILENEMRAKYDNLWRDVVFKLPPWTLLEVLQCLLKHWIAVFNEVFPRIEYLITDLKNSLCFIENKGPNTLTQSEVSNFKELCLEVAKRCQIIPEYMELAKTTVERLQDTSESEDESAAVSGGGSEKDGETPVIDAFEGVWTVFSSYCAKLASALGVEHTVEDKLPGTDSLEVLSSKLSLFGNQISTLANTMDGVLNVAANSPAFSENVSRLERAFKDSLAELGMDSRDVTNSNIRVFSTKCRTMLQEAQVFGRESCKTAHRNYFRELKTGLSQIIKPISFIQSSTRFSILLTGQAYV